MQAKFIKHSLQFKLPSGTSRGVLTSKNSWFLTLTDGVNSGIGECSILNGLSYDHHQDFENQLEQLCLAINMESPLPNLIHWPAIQMGYETAKLGLSSEDSFNIFPSDFTEGKKSIPINGLVWMGSYDFMSEQINDLLNRGFNCIKIKIGSIQFDEELDLIAKLRKRYKTSEISIRVDANGAFRPEEALDKSQRLSNYDVHSIEQPIQVNQWKEMADLCKKSPVPIALDEELIGRFSLIEKQNLLDQIRPHYLILKPSLLGGFKNSDQWIDLAKSYGIDWWATSALESNVGLNAIAQWAFKKNVNIPQGLGTGSLFKNNIESPLLIRCGCLWMENSIPWDNFF